MSVDPSDRRRHERIETENFEAELMVGGETVPVEVTNISLGGFQVVSSLTFEPETEVILRPDSSGVEYPARAVRCFVRGEERFLCGFTVELDDPLDRIGWVDLVESMKSG